MRESRVRVPEGVQKNRSTAREQGGRYTHRRLSDVLQLARVLELVDKAVLETVAVMA